ncbi:MAG: hypothetical protein WCW35_14660 [Bacteroidota bacterium]|jgi:hypothetical protein
MEKPKYKIGTEEISLAEPTPKRISEFLKLHNVKNLSDLLTPKNIDETASSAGKYALDITGDSQSASKLLTACLDSPVSEETAGNLSVDVIAQVSMDFFLTLILKQRLRVK